jgi:hypothetical protein
MTHPFAGAIALDRENSGVAAIALDRKNSEIAAIERMTQP